MYGIPIIREGGFLTNEDIIARPHYDGGNEEEMRLHKQMQLRLTKLDKTNVKTKYRLTWSGFKLSENMISTENQVKPTFDNLKHQIIYESRHTFNSILSEQIIKTVKSKARIEYPSTGAKGSRVSVSRSNRGRKRSKSTSHETDKDEASREMIMSSGMGMSMGMDVGLSLGGMGRDLGQSMGMEMSMGSAGVGMSGEGGGVMGCDDLEWDC